eukprot:TRINITY_DN74526_c0_g1_i1.p1 TRINITY_DN74526_c0_g1~~TRINITY_DN74526_c0_g1_i1.p1  ORF type:complete len:322 (-),score=54.59 TRINITY_DN74526_c0_g1_i1:440-1405(-)
MYAGADLLSGYAVGGVWRGNEGVKHYEQCSRPPPPESCEVPLPRIPRCNRLHPAERVAFVFRHNSADLQSVLTEVGLVLVNGKMRARSATDLGRKLSPISRAWLAREHLSLVKVLRCFPSYFKVSPAGGVTFLPQFLPDYFVPSDQSPAATAGKEDATRAAGLPLGPSHEVSVRPEPVTAEDDRDAQANSGMSEEQGLHPEVFARPESQRSAGASPGMLEEQEPSEVSPLRQEGGISEQQAEKEAAALSQQPIQRSESASDILAPAEENEEEDEATMSVPQQTSSAGQKNKDVTDARIYDEVEAGQDQMDDMDEEVVFISL